MEKASVTISRPRKGTGEDVISITIKDPLSRQTIIGVEMDAAEFTSCLTGLAEYGASVERLSPAEHRDRWGKQRITKVATCPKVFGKAEQADEVQKAFVEGLRPPYRRAVRLRQAWSYLTAPSDLAS